MITKDELDMFLSAATIVVCVWMFVIGFKMQRLSKSWSKTIDRINKIVDEEEGKQ